MRIDQIKPNVVVRGPLFPEPVQVIVSIPMDTINKGEWRPRPKRATAFREGHEQIFDEVTEDFLGGAVKAEGEKLPGVGILLKPCPRKSAAEKE